MSFVWIFVSVVSFCAITTTAQFNPLQHGGPSSPYFDAPSQYGIPTETPQGCVVDQAAYMSRHGTRFPEPGSYSGWQYLYSKFQSASYTASGPLSFIGSWVPAVDDRPHQPLYLTSTGSQESFALGAQLRRRYGFTPGGDNFTIWSADQQRCLDTAAFIARGYVSQGNYLDTSGTKNRATVIQIPDIASDANSLTPSTACPAYNKFNNGSASATVYRATYQNRIATRLNRFLKGDLVLNATDIGIMQDLCGFGYGINEEHRFCDVFTEDEWLDYEYAHDLNYYYGSGPGNALSATVGFPWVKAIANLFKVGPGNTVDGGNLVPPRLVFGVTHDNNLPPFLSALNLWNASVWGETRGIYPLSKTSRDSRRTFRASYSVAFRSTVALERLTCSSPPAYSVYHAAGQLTIPSNNTQTYVRVRINNAPVPIPTCASGPGSTCPLSQFSQYIDKRGQEVGSFDVKCGLAAGSVKNDVSFLTTRNESAEVLIGDNWPLPLKL